MEDGHDYPKEDDGNEENSSMVEEEEKEEIIPPVVQEQTEEEHATGHQAPFFSSSAPEVQDKPDILSSQHLSFPSNSWGGASPLLSHNIPPESLEVSYEKLDKVRSYDDLVPPSPYVAADPVKEGEEIHELEKDPFLKLFMKLKEKKWKMPKMDARSRWPQGLVLGHPK